MELDKNKVIMIGIIGISIFFMIGFTASVINDAPDPIYLLHIPRNIATTLIAVVWPFFGSLLFVILFPRIFAPLYLKSKIIQFRGYKNVYIKKEKPDLSVGRIFKRGLSVSLLSIGLAVTLIGFGIINPMWVASAPAYAHYLSLGANLNYTLEAVLLIPALIYPIIVGLYAIGWAIEDCGIMHYNIPDEDSDKFFEIEPVHYKYNDYLSGYAGFSSIIFILGAIFYYLMKLDIAQGLIIGDTVTTLMLILFSIIILLIPMLLSYLLYWKHDKSYLIKDLKEARRISREELESLLEKR